MNIEFPRQKSKLWRYVSRLLFIIGVGYLFAWVYVLVLFSGILQPSALQGINRADEIFVALEQYRQVVGQYPTKLEKLVPNYVNQVPNAGLWYEYRYHTCTDATRYVLDFSARGHMQCRFSGNRQEWQCIDSVLPLPPVAVASACLDE